MSELPPPSSIVLWLPAGDKTHPGFGAVVTGINSVRQSLDLAVFEPHSTTFRQDVRWVDASPPPKKWREGVGYKVETFGPGAWTYSPQHREIAELKAQVRQLQQLLQSSEAGTIPAST